MNFWLVGGLVVVIAVLCWCWYRAGHARGFALGLSVTVQDWTHK